MSYDYLEWGGGVYDHLTRLARLCTDNICSSRCARYARFQSSKGTHAALHAGGVVGAGVNGVERRLAVWKMGCSLSAAVAAFHLQWRLCAICDKHNPSSSTLSITRHLQRSTHAGKRQHRLSTCVSSNTTSALSVCAFAYSLKHVSSPFRFRQSSTARARRCLQQRSP